MKLTSLSLPIDPAERPAWLEAQLVGAELRNLVLELETIRGPRSTTTSLPNLADVLGSKRTVILRNGLAGLSPQEVASLLQNPRLLLDLQEAVLCEGGPYWQHLVQTSEPRLDTNTQWERISARLDNTNPASPSPVAKVAGQSSSPAGNKYTLRWLAGLAACAVVAFTLWTRPNGPTWGFDRSGILTANVSGQEYLESLASAAGDWFNKRPSDSPAVATRLREFIHGCDTLIQAPHSQLSPNDRAWLVERCRTWKATLETQLANLEAHRTSPADTLSAADATIRKLQTALQERATQAA